MVRYPRLHTCTTQDSGKKVLQLGARDIIPGGA